MPRSAAQFEQMRQKSRQAIMQAALELFAVRGFHATSIEKIAQKAGVAKGLVYNYFDGKETLLKAVISEGFSEIDALIRQRMDINGTQEKMRHLLEAQFQILTEKKEYWKLYLALLMQPEVINNLEHSLREFYQYLVQVLEGLFHELGSESPEMEALLLGALLDGVAMNFLINDPDYPVEQVKAAIIKKYCS